MTQSVFETGQDFSTVSGVSYGAGAGARGVVGVGVGEGGGGGDPDLETVYSVFDVTDCVIDIANITLFVAAAYTCRYKCTFRDSLTYFEAQGQMFLIFSS